MKKIKQLFLLAGLMILLSIQVNAQEIGIRFGNFHGNDVSLDGIFSTGQFSRVHANVGFGRNGLGVDALWNPIYKNIENSDFKWYAGFGPSVYLSEDFRLGGTAEIGTEYLFPNIPLTLGVDFRPYLFLVEVTEFRTGVGLNARWRLN